MAISAAEHREVPYIDLLSYVFGNSTYDQGKPLFIDADNESISVSRHQAKIIIRKLIAGLRALGLQRGDTVCLHSYNNVHYSMIFLAVIGAGGRFVGANPAFTPVELNHLYETSDVKFVLLEPSLMLNVFPTIRQRCISTSSVLWFGVDKGQDGVACDPWTKLMNHGEEDWITFDDETTAKTTTAALMSTSGTTGLPKAAEISHFAFIAQSIMCYDSAEKAYRISRLTCLPQFHGFAAPFSHISPLREGHPAYIMRRYQLAPFVQHIKRYQITETTLVNPIVLNLLALPENEQGLLQSLRFAWVAGSPLDASVQNRLSARLHQDAIISQVWGMTEMGWATAFLYPEKDTTGSVGRLLPNIEAKVVDESLQEINKEGERGEVLIRSPSIMTSYFKNTDATSSAILDGGWLQTGDIGYHKDGKWYIVDRVKEVIKVRGWQVCPAELEGVLLMHDAVLDAAVIGVNFLDGRGELPRAYVVLDNELVQRVTDREIENFLALRLSKFKVLAGGVVRLNAIPRGPSGKILKRELRDQAKEEISLLVANTSTIEGVGINGTIERGQQAVVAVPNDKAQLVQEVAVESEDM